MFGFRLGRSALYSAAASVLLTATAAHADISPSDVKEGFRKNAALAQFYRWYQLYERNEGGIANALDILDEDIYVKSGLGEANGHADYETRVKSLPTTWQNSHQVKSVDVKIDAEGALSLSAQITYQNLGMLDDNAVRQAELSYAITYAPSDDLLPKLATVEITPVAESGPDAFVDAYPENRVKSLVHYWLAIIEDPARDPEPFKEILAQDPSINFSSGKIQDYDGLAKWLAETGSQVAASTHVIDSLSVTQGADNTWQAEMVFDWAGLLPDGTELIAKTRHNWVIENDVTERFARVKQVDVEVLEPFRPKP